MKYSQVQTVGWIINVYAGLASVLLALRAVFELFSASASAEFVHWVYQTSTTLLQPFREVYSVAPVTTGHTIDFGALFAILVYATAGYVLVKWVNRRR